MTGWDIEAHPLSASKLKTFERCPKQFELSYLDGHEETVGDTTFLDIGNAVHLTIEEVICRVIDRQRSDRVDMAPVQWRTEFMSSLWEVVGGDVEYADPDPRQDFPIRLDDDQREQVTQCLGTAARWLAKAQPTIRGVEVDLDFRIRRPDIDVPVTGYIDLATGSEVVDWKTGKSDGKGLDEALQGAVYMAGYYHEFGEVPDAIRYVYLNPQKGSDHPKSRTLTPDDDLWQELLGRARTLVVQAEAGEFVAQPGDPKCKWCDYERFCPESPVGAGSIDWEAYP